MLISRIFGYKGHDTRGIGSVNVWKNLFDVKEVVSNPLLYIKKSWRFVRLGVREIKVFRYFNRPGFIGMENWVFLVGREENR